MTTTDPTTTTPSTDAAPARRPRRRRPAPTAPDPIDLPPALAALRAAASPALRAAADEVMRGAPALIPADATAAWGVVAHKRSWLRWRNAGRVALAIVGGRTMVPKLELVRLLLEAADRGTAPTTPGARPA